MQSQKHSVAIKRYSDILTFDHPNLSDILYKRSKAHSLTSSWQEALIDADKVWVALHVRY